MRHDPSADLAALRRLAVRSQRFSPLVGIDDTPPFDTLLFNIRGCAHLFGGERTLARRVLRAFSQRRFVASAGLADTVGAAWAVAHYATSYNRGGSRPEEAGRGGRPEAVCIVPPGQQKQVLAPLPVEGLRLDPQVVATLHQLDIRSIGQLERLPRSTLPSRFGPGLVQRLDQAWGRMAEPITPERLREPAAASCSFEHPTADRHRLQRACDHLTERILAQLHPQQRGVLQLAGRMICRNREQVAFNVGLVQPSVSAAHLGELIRVHLERLTLPGEVATVVLEAISTGPLTSRQRTFHHSPADRQTPAAGFSIVPAAGQTCGELETAGWEPAYPASPAYFPAGEDFEAHAGELAVLLDRLSSRLGARAVLRPRLRDDFLPEYVSMDEPMLPGPSPEKNKTQPAGPRASSRTAASSSKETTTRSPEETATLFPGKITTPSRRSTTAPSQRSLTTPSAPPGEQAGASGQLPAERGLLTQQPETAADRLSAPPVFAASRPLHLSRNPPAARVTSVVPNGPPVRLQCGSLNEKIVRAWGPERIETGWWRHPQIARDYYRVETYTGQHFWIYRDTRDGQWYLHGTFE